MLGRPFFVIATENPIELEGTFPLPEAQLDRFMLKLSTGYVKTVELESRYRAQDPVEDRRPYQHGQACR